jgi:hypothetical protein
MHRHRRDLQRVARDASAEKHPGMHQHGSSRRMMLAHRIEGRFDHAGDAARQQRIAGGRMPQPSLRNEPPELFRLTQGGEIQPKRLSIFRIHRGRENAHLVAACAQRRTHAERRLDFAERAEGTEQNAKRFSHRCLPAVPHQHTKPPETAGRSWRL